MAGGSESRRSMAGYSVAAHREANVADARLARYNDRLGRVRKERAVWPGAAFIVEALLLLVFLTGSLAVLMNLNAESDRIGRESAHLMNALVMASNSAEEFAADPAAMTGAQTLDAEDTDANLRYEGDLVLVRDVTAEPTEAGVMYRAVITVWDQDAVSSISAPNADAASYEVTLVDEGAEPIYQVETAAYVSGDVVPEPAGTPLAGTPVGGTARDGEVS